MISVRSLRGLLNLATRPLPPVAPSEPLCIHCGLRAAVQGDGEPRSCAVCALRLAAVAAAPDRFPDWYIADLWEGHRDAVRLFRPQCVHVTAAVGMAWRSSHALALAWDWALGWPGDDTTVADEARIAAGGAS